MSEKKMNPVVHLVAWMVENDQGARARLIEELDQRKQNGEEPGGEWPGWKRFAIHFADRYPYSTLFVPIAVALYIVSFYQILGG